MPTDGKTRTYGCLDQLSDEQLRDLLRADFESPGDGDDELTMRILEVMEKRERPAGLPDAQQAWEDFQRYFLTPDATDRCLYPTEEPGPKALEDRREERPKRRRSRILKRLLPVAAVVAVMFSGMVAAQALGMDVFGALARWTDETFRFIAGPQASAAEPEPESEALRQAVQDALDSCGITDIPAPSWYPEGTELVEDIDVTKNNDTLIITSEFEYDKGTFVIVIQYYPAEERIVEETFEKDASNVERYSAVNRTFYIVSNLNSVSAIYSDGKIVMTIDGTLSQENIKRIVDSIGG